MFLDFKMFKKILLNLAKSLMVFLAFYLALRTFEYFSFRTDTNFLKVRQELVHQLLWMVAFYLHISGALLALAVGSLQFWPSFRNKHLKIHRIFGKLYAAGIAIAGPAGLYMAFFARGGLFAQIGFVCLDLVWIATTYLGVRAILRHDVPTHQRWITRSYAITFAAVTLRLWVPILSLGFGLNETQVLSITPWLSWIPNLLLAEVVLLFLGKRSPKL